MYSIAKKSTANKWQKQWKLSFDAYTNNNFANTVKHFFIILSAKRISHYTKFEIRNNNKLYYVYLLELKVAKNVINNVRELQT